MTKKKPKPSRPPADFRTIAPGVTISTELVETGPVAPPELPGPPIVPMTPVELVERYPDGAPSTDATPAVAPIGRRLDKGLVWEVEPTWAERAAKMASAAGLTPEQFLDSLLRRAWVGFPTSKRGA